MTITRHRQCQVCLKVRQCWHTGVRWLCGECWDIHVKPRLTGDDAA